MEFKTGDTVIFCEEEYEIIRIDSDSELDLLIEDDRGYKLWVSHTVVRSAA